MSTPPDKPAPPVRWETIERVATKAEAERLEAMSEEELDAVLRAAGFDDGAADRIADAALRGRRRPPRRWRATSAVIAAAAALIGVVAWQGSRLPALLTGGPGPVGPAHPGSSQGSTPEERAASLRGEALAACTRGLWSTCRAKLDEAKTLDPAGEADPRVTKARQDIAAAVAGDAAPPRGAPLR